MSIYHWKMGDVALAKICNKFYAKVQVVKNKDGIFYDDKVLGFSENEDGSTNIVDILCYYVEIIRTKARLWLPYTSLHLAERSRPFYGSKKILSPKKPVSSITNKKRKIKQDHIVPLDVKLSNIKQPDLNISYDIRHTPLKEGKYENAYKEFVRRHKETLFDEVYRLLNEEFERNRDTIDYVANVDASTEDKFEMIIKNYATERELEHYSRQCWRYNFVYKQMESRNKAENINTSASEKLQITIHTNWCLVCGKKDKLRECPACPSAFHLACRKEWLTTIIHRKSPPKKPQKQETLIEKILSSTRTICTIRKGAENNELCPSCMWGPRIGYDDVVWHKLGSCCWWPARVLPPGEVPACLLSQSHNSKQWPLKYYGALNYSWGDAERMSLFLPTHTSLLGTSCDQTLQQGVLDACDDYISVYLT